jgi:hypothetical protein
MSDFQTLRDALTEEVHEYNDDTIVSRAVITALKSHRSKEFPWSSESATFSTASGVDSYPRGAFVDASAMRISHVRVDNASLYSELTMVSQSQMHRMQHQTSSTPTGTPTHWAWIDEAMVLYPTPSSATTIAYDYLKDPMRDSSGKEFTTSSTTETNEMFTRGEVLLRAAAGYHYCLTRTQDDASAQRFRVIYEEAWRDLVAERDMMQMKSQVEGYF